MTTQPSTTYELYLNNKPAKTIQVLLCKQDITQHIPQVLAITTDVCYALYNAKVQIQSIDFENHIIHAKEAVQP
ncbi:hypothetical protein [Candidatus Bathycorpusculum sp.]|uniref:hypothetical protein n=1 Tax=Candidatus Bathycorpusculum sp. TaxID=2994959 RepID=UPI002824CF60|nr:hypothetical protein [Candidatus Termitimicrobium sp.]